VYSSDTRSCVDLRGAPTSCGRRRRVGRCGFRRYLEDVADQRLRRLGFAARYGARNPFGFMELQDVQDLSNVVEPTVSAYQVGISGDVAVDEDS
jgi:hypothetical protein